MERSTPSDATLIAACRRGDELAWTTLIERYAQLIYHIPLRRGLPPDQAADVFQDVLALLLDKLDQIEQPDRIRAWLVTAARWETARMLRSKAHANEVSLSDEDAGETPDAASELDELLISSEEQRILEQGMALLDPRCAMMITLLFRQSPTPQYSEVAQVLGIAEGSIGPTRARCLDKLRRILNDLGF